MERRKLGFSKPLKALLPGLALWAAYAYAFDKDYAKKIEVESPKSPTVEGGVFFVSVRSTDDIAEVSGKFNGRDVTFFPDHDVEGGLSRFTAMVGVEDGLGLGSDKPRTMDMDIHACMAKSFAPTGKSKCLDRRISILVQTGVFPSEKLRVPPRTIEPSKKDKIQIAKDRIVLKKVYSSSVKKKYWDPPAAMPVPFGVTSDFGSRRVYNGKVANAHYGTDMRAPTSTPIVAPFSGKVALARKLFYTGYTVILDHGYGLFTIYGHMSALRVKEGAVANKAQILGLAGATGRASGPHLHWGVNLHGAKIDPLLLVKALNPEQKPLTGGVGALHQAGIDTGVSAAAAHP